MQTIFQNIVFSDRPAWEDTDSDDDYVNVQVHWPNDNTPVKNYWPTEHLSAKVLYFSVADNDVLVRVLASLDGGETFPIIAVAEFTLETASPVVVPVSNYYHALKIQVKSIPPEGEGEAEVGTLSVSGGGSNLVDLSDVEISLDKSGLATQTTTAAILAKIISAPATEASLSSIDGKLAKGDQLKAASLSVAPATDIPAGRAIGKVTLDGPSAPTPVSISFASADPQTIIAAPSAGNRIRITSLFLSSAVNMTVAMKSASTTIGTIYGLSFAKDWVQPLLLGTAEAFILDAVGADQIYGQVCYYVEAV